MRLFARKKRPERIQPGPEEQAVQDAADRELDEILRTARHVSGVILVGALAGGLIGGLDWIIPVFSTISLLVLMAIAAGLAGLLKRALAKEPLAAVLFFAVLLVGALLLGFHLVQYELFLHQMEEEIIARYTRDLKIIFPVEIPGLIDEILLRRTGSSGIVGFNLMRFQQVGRFYPAVWAARAALALAAALLVIRRKK